MRTTETTIPCAAEPSHVFRAAGRWLAQAAIMAFVLSTSTGLAANPLRAEEQPAELATSTNVPPAEAVAVMPAAATPVTHESDADLKLPPSHPTRVEIDIEIVEISQIQDHDQKFDVEFNAYFVWNDPRLAFDAREAGVHKKTVPADELWTPDPLLVDELDVDERGGTTAHVQPDGTVYLNRYYRGTITGSFDLHEFPMDRHDLEIALEATDYEAEEVVFAAGEVRAKNPAHVVPHGWELIDMESSAGESNYARTNETFSLFRTTIRVTRDPHFYLWSIVLPLLPIMATAWSVFWMDPKEFSSQVGVGITAMLTVVAYRITIDSSLPPLTYMTRMDYFLIICQTFVFLAFVASVSIHVLYALDVPHMRARAARLTELSRWLPPLVLTVVSILLAALPVRYGTYVIMAPAVLAAIWLRKPLLHLPRTLKTLVRPELLLEVPEPRPAESPTPHGQFGKRGKEADVRSGERRSA
ncbi:MAG TPA: hypothetical protein VHD36_10870 [Pirellulales bacterium]|nr:hypothetical protein [Pirellulales bacterium]